MDDSGHLDKGKGTEIFRDGTSRKLGAEAESIGSQLLLTVTADVGDTYKGILAFQFMNQTFMVVTGKLHLHKDGTERGTADVDDADLEAVPFDQDDPPVVITKP
jgi:hypothetical protein